METENDWQITRQLIALEELLRSLKRVMVAFSGGVDSTLLAKVARDTLGKRSAIAVTADSVSFARWELNEARRIARELDLEHIIMITDELANPDYQSNPSNRCYFCKQVLFERLDVLSKQRGVPFVLYGAIGDDEPAERPGQKAAVERRVRAPLQEVGLSKRDVRVLARKVGLPNWDRPQNACLASRIPHGLPVTKEKLKQVESAEVLLRSYNFRQVRVRHINDHARIEVGADEVARFEDESLGTQVAREFEYIGFTSVGVDRLGYRFGAANQGSPDELHLL